MAGNKTANKNTRATASKAVANNEGDSHFITPCNHGKNAYVRNSKAGTNRHVRTNSDAFIAEVSEVAKITATHPVKLRAEFEALAAQYPADGWDEALARLDAAGALA